MMYNAFLVKVVSVESVMGNLMKLFPWDGHLYILLTAFHMVSLIAIALSLVYCLGYIRIKIHVNNKNNFYMEAF